MGDLMLTSREFRTYVDVGYYARQLRRYLDLFPGSSLKLVLHSRFRRDPGGVMRELFEFLGVDPDFRVSDMRRRNVSLQKGKVRRTLVAMNVGPGIPGDAKAKARRVKKELMTAGTRRFLLRHYASHNRRLEALSGLDLSGWNR